MTYEIPPKPHDYVPPPKQPKRSPQDYARLGMLTIAVGAAFFIGGVIYGVRGSTMSLGQAVVSMLPLLLVFAAFGWTFWRRGAEGLGPLVAYLAAAVGLCAAVAAWLWGK